MVETNDSEFERARQVLVGGVNSAVRAFRAVGGTPLSIRRARGAYTWDVEGKRYIDYLCSWGAIIVGHGHPSVVEAVEKAARDGLSFGAPNFRETDLAERLASVFPHIERVRFTSSGTEATMAALRLARGYTNRSYILKFEGCYHGASDSLLVKAGSGALAFGISTSAGIPDAVIQNTYVAEYNDISSLEALFSEHGRNIAGVIVEPVAGNMNLVLPDKNFLIRLRELCDESGAILIFDEVMSGFRVGLQGAQGYYGVVPDLSTFGKVIGGGLPVGALAGSARIMNCLAPEGPVYQAGTLSGNPIAMAAGIATLDLVFQPGFFENLSLLSSRLVNGIRQHAVAVGISVCAQFLGGMAGLYFLSAPPVSFRQATEQNMPEFKRFFHYMLEEGVYLPPSPFESFFLSSALTQDDVDATCEAVGIAFRKLSRE